MRLNVEHTARVEAMPLFSFEGKRPNVHPTAFIAPTAVLIGDVTVEERASVWYNAVLRGDLNPIVVRAGANVQDCRSEEHTSELQSQSNLVCRLLLEKKKRTHRCSRLTSEIRDEPCPAVR